MKKVVVDTDIILDHLTDPVPSGGSGMPSVLRQVMSQLFCYTTVFNAIELFSLCESAHERLVVENVMRSMKILGLNGKSAKSVGWSFGQPRARSLRTMELLIAGVCLESRLPLLTGRPRRYQGVRSLRVMTSEEIIASHKKGLP